MNMKRLKNKWMCSFHVLCINELHCACQVERMTPGSLPLSISGPVVLVINKADGDEEVVYLVQVVIFLFN